MSGGCPCLSFDGTQDKPAGKNAIINSCQKHISLKPTADAWAIIYHQLKRALEIIYKNAF